MNDVVAVVIPAFRCENTINPTLDSVLAQHRRADRVVIVLDEPNPDLEAICRTHDINAEVIVNQTNLGVAATRNIGFERVKDKADLVCFLDADDVLHADFLVVACAQFQAKPETRW